MHKTVSEHMEEIKDAIRLMVASGFTMTDATNAFKQQYAITALEMSKRNNCKASMLVGVHRNTMSRILPKSEFPTVANRKAG